MFIWKPGWPAERDGLVRRSQSIVIHIVKISVQFMEKRAGTAAKISLERGENSRLPDENFSIYM